MTYSRSASFALRCSSFTERWLTDSWVFAAVAVAALTPKQLSECRGQRPAGHHRGEDPVPAVRLDCRTDDPVQRCERANPGVSQLNPLSTNRHNIYTVRLGILGLKARYLIGFFACAVAGAYAVGVYGAGDAIAVDASVSHGLLGGQKIVWQARSR